jgi:excisionase family DNA binding protein
MYETYAAHILRSATSAHSKGDPMTNPMHLIRSDSDTYSIKEIQALLGISTASAYNLLHTEGFPSAKIGKRYVVPRLAFETWLDNEDEH